MLQSTPCQTQPIPPTEIHQILDTLHPAKPTPQPSHGPISIRTIGASLSRSQTTKEDVNPSDSKSPQQLTIKHHSPVRHCVPFRSPEYSRNTSQKTHLHKPAPTSPSSKKVPSVAPHCKTQHSNQSPRSTVTHSTPEYPPPNSSPNK